MVGILADHQIEYFVKECGMISPFEADKQQFYYSTAYGRFTLSYGLSICGYDIRLSSHESSNFVISGNGFGIFSTLENFIMPPDVCGIVHDKSTLARKGIAVQNTVLEPGWKGFLTLEISNSSKHALQFLPGMPIGQIIFHRLSEIPRKVYDGKYQNQANMPVEAR